MSKAMSIKIIDPNSEIIAERHRNPNEKIEDKLLREGQKTKLKAMKMKEDNFKASAMSPPTKRKKNYKQVKYFTIFIDFYTLDCS